MGASDQIQRNIQYSHSHRLYFGITVLFLGISICNAGESKEVSWNEPLSAQLHLFQKVKAIAETGSLFDPDTIAKILETDFQTKTTESVTPSIVRENRVRCKLPACLLLHHSGIAYCHQGSEMFNCPQYQSIGHSSPEMQNLARLLARNSRSERDHAIPQGLDHRAIWANQSHDIRAKAAPHAH